MFCKTCTYICLTSSCIVAFCPCFGQPLCDIVAGKLNFCIVEYTGLCVLRFFLDLQCSSIMLAVVCFFATSTKILVSNSSLQEKISKII